VLGYAADVAGTGVEAVAATRRQRYDLVLMDCQMPEMDGFEATRLMLADARAAGAEAPAIVAITANAMEGDAALCLAAGMHAYLSKPIGLDDLRRMLQRFS
jgi:CheY-like chemotaxis protein